MEHYQTGVMRAQATVPSNCKAAAQCAGRFVSWSSPYLASAATMAISRFFRKVFPNIVIHICCIEVHLLRSILQQTDRLNQAPALPQSQRHSSGDMYIRLY